MDTYKKTHSALFNQITDTLTVIDRCCAGLKSIYKVLDMERESLKKAQAAVEEFVIRNDESLEEDGEATR